MEVQQQAGFPGGQWEIDQSPSALAGGVPDGCCIQAYNMYVDPVGVLRTRNGVKGLQNTSWAINEQLSWVWEGNLTPGQRTVFANRGIPGSPGATDSSHGYGVLDGSNNGVKIGPGGGGYYYQDKPTSYTLLDGMLFIGNQAAIGNTTDTTKQGLAYGGSRKTSSYVVAGNTLTCTQGSKVVTKATGGFTANVDVGMLLYCPGSGGPPAISSRYMVVASVDSDTQITLVKPWPAATGSYQAYFQVMALIGSGTNPSYRASKIYGQCAGRLLSLEGNKLYVSAGPDPATGLLQPELFPTENIIEFPLDAQGVSVQTIRNQVFVFTTQGLYRITGLEYDITDPDGNPQWTIELLSHELVAVTHSGIVTWHMALIVPCMDGIWIIDGVNPPQLISAGVDWSHIVNAGRGCGQAAVYQGYYLLPVEIGAGSGTYDTYVFRLAPVQTSRGLVFPHGRWQINGSLGGASWYSSGSNRLIVTNTLKVSDASSMFDVGAVYTRDIGAGSGTFVNSQCSTGIFDVPDGSVLRRVRLLLGRDIDNGEGFPNTFVSVYSLSNSQGLASITPSSGHADGRDRQGGHWYALDLSTPLQGKKFYVDIQDQAQRLAILGVEIQYRTPALPVV